MEIILLATELGLLCQGRRTTDHFHFSSISASDQAVIFSDIWLLSPKLTVCSGKRVTLITIMWHQSSVVVSLHAFSFCKAVTFHCPVKYHSKTSPLDVFLLSACLKSAHPTASVLPLRNQDCWYPIWHDIPFICFFCETLKSVWYRYIAWCYREASPWQSHW